MQLAEKLYVQGYISYPRTETTSYPSSFDLMWVIEEDIAKPFSWISIHTNEIVEEHWETTRTIQFGDKMLEIYYLKALATQERDRMWETIHLSPPWSLLQKQS